MKALKQLRSSQGMTLLEIMVVLAILGSLIGVLVNTVSSRMRKAKVSQAKIQIAELGKSLDLFYTDCNFYPDSLESLVEADSECGNWGPDPYLKKSPKDPWNNEFVYEKDGGSFVLISLGEDGREGGDGNGQDISSEDL